MGDRYKCAVCHDTDFCANCEASPSNSHNKTHPLIKFRTPVRNVSVTTMGDHDNGQAMPLMGDRRASTLSRATETTPAPLTNAATQVQTVADFQPSEARAEELEAASAEITPSTPAELKSDAQRSVKNVLVARFVRDTIQDGTLLPPNSVFEQTWVLRNDGNAAWPAGCTVKFVGGDNMCALDPEHPASVHELVSATESTTCYTEVGPGQEFGFTVLMRTPSRPGKVISYWRLTGPSGHKFGHKLWCDVTVPHTVKPEQKEEPVAEPIEEAKEEDKSEAEHSHMIFPKLENESPLTSVHQELPPVESSAVADELTDEDFESAGGFDDETEDGFLTDEEYDILDASDEEYLVEQDEIAKK
ncbi:MAG: hypothetical protein M1818_002640 [Claussenomyces sp. TS43310]|nr:MAG: hypothetical protein M1818_002640 [Claussenomyces sp. TS43310]